ncbi:MAG: dihydroorotate dehydrogenase [Planctomycetes bacterium]|nr:dihydroorotate dehydrogenase [Planctomycetota bacterium]
MSRVADLAVDFAGLKLRNPLVAASGTCGWGEELERIEGFSSSQLGAIILKSVTREPRLGNPTPRVVETAGGAGLINSIGLENPGVDAVVRDYLPRLADAPTVVIGNVAGSVVDDYAAAAEQLCASPVIQAVEVNISCPNVKKGGILFGVDPDAAAAVVAAVRGVTDKPVIAKLTPNVTDIAPIARACIQAGANALSVSNTFRALAIDVRTHRPLIGANFGGLSGPAIKPLSLLKVHETFAVARPAGVPILGGGGIMTGSDAVEFILAGATACFVGTLLLREAAACGRLLDELAGILDQQGIRRVADLVGGLILNE